MTRVRELREKLGLSQAAFSDRVGMSRDMVNNLERGRVTLTELKAKAICNEFNVNYDWLMNGNGTMFQELSREEELMQWLHGVCDDGTDFKKRFVSALARLGDMEWQMLEYIIDKIYAEDRAEKKAQKNHRPMAFRSRRDIPRTEDEIQEEGEAYKEQLRNQAKAARAASSGQDAIANEA